MNIETKNKPNKKYIIKYKTTENKTSYFQINTSIVCYGKNSKKIFLLKGRLSKVFVSPGDTNTALVTRVVFTHDLCLVI